MTNPPLPPALPAPFNAPTQAILASLTPSDLPPAELRALTNLIRKHVTIEINRGPRRHWIWAGPLRPGFRVPLIHRWLGHKNVSAVNTLWRIFKPFEPLPARARLRRLDSCAYDLCVNPACFEIAAIPMEAQTLPDDIAQPINWQRTMANGGRITRLAKVNALEGLRDRYTYRGQNVVSDILCDCGCGVVVHDYLVVCDLGHLQRADWTRTPDGRSEMMGRQFRCGPCTKITEAIREIRGSKPRAGHRPTSPAHNNAKRETDNMIGQWWTDDLPREGPLYDAQRADDDEREYAEMDRAIDALPASPDQLTEAELGYRRMILESEGIDAVRRRWPGWEPDE